MPESNITKEAIEATDAPILTPAGSVAPGSIEQRNRETPKTWLDFQHPEYTNNSALWAFAQAHYTADVLRPDQMDSYLIKRSSGESENAYEERKKLADYTPHFGAVVDSLAGMLFQVESRADRKLLGLGDHLDLNSAMSKIWNDVDGAGTNYLTFWKQMAIDLVVFHLSWCIVDTNVVGDRSRLRSWPALAVPNWRWEHGVLVEVLLKEQAEVRSSITQDPAPIDRWVLYDLEGWQRWVKNANGDAQSEGEKVPYDFRNMDGDRVLPIFPVNLPMKRNVGYILARKANVIFNKESERDHLLRVANFPYLNLIASDEQYEAITEKMQKGWRVLQNDPSHRGGKSHHFIAPSADSAKVASDVLIRKVDEFWITAFREYSDSAQERVTATEIRQDVSSGVGAFLQMLKAGVDEAENGALFRMAQIELPNAKASWFNNTVERSEDFVPIDIQSEIDKLRKRYFGETGQIPTGRTGKVAAAKKIAGWDGIEIEEEELEAAVDLQLLRENMEPFRELPSPPEVLEEFTVGSIVANGSIDPNAVKELDGGEEVKLIDLVKERAVQMAETLASAQQALAQPIPPAPGGVSGGSEE